MIKNYLTALLIFIIAINSSYLSAATWRILFYMDSTENLNDMALKAITDIIRGKPNNTIELLIQLHAYADTGIRYQVTDYGLIFLNQVSLTGNSKQDLIDALTWVFSTPTHTDHTMLILSNHGWGILDPQWNPITNTWEAGSHALSNTIADLNTGYNNTCAIKQSPHTILRHKGFMFNSNPRTYLNNQDFTETLDYLKTNLLQGKNLTVLAFDTCMGAMLEVAYQSAPYVDYLVGSQSCSLPDGFDYHGITTMLNEQPAPRHTVTNMVKIFDAYYSKHDSSGIYTHAALDLSYTKQIKHALDTVISILLSQPEYQPVITQTHLQTPRFCLWPQYTDILTFCKHIESNLTIYSPALLTTILKTALHQLYTITEQFVIARCGGYNTQNNAYGFAIYLPAPQDAIHESYPKTIFARESQWLHLLTTICSQ